MESGGSLSFCLTDRENPANTERELVLLNKITMPMLGSGLSSLSRDGEEIEESF